MTKKDYIALANIIKSNGTMANLRRGITHVITTGTFMNSLCEYLKNDNSSFDEIKFREATGEILNKEVAQMIKKINLIYRRIMWKFSKQDIKAVLKYDPLNLLQ